MKGYRVSLDFTKILYVGYLPRRRSVALCMEEGAVSSVLGYFVSAEAAEDFMELIDGERHPLEKEA